MSRPPGREPRAASGALPHRGAALIVRPAPDGAKRGP